MFCRLYSLIPSRKAGDEHRIFAIFIGFAGNHYYNQRAFQCSLFMEMTEADYVVCLASRLEGLWRVQQVLLSGRISYCSTKQIGVSTSQWAHRRIIHTLSLPKRMACRTLAILVRYSTRAWYRKAISYASPLHPSSLEDEHHRKGWTPSERMNTIGKYGHENTLDYQ